MAITIENPSDWLRLRKDGFETVVDPMVFRCGELFLKGARNAQAPDKVWELLNQNVHALGMFFDCLVLNEKIPVFNYADTFDRGLNFDQRELTRINDYDEVLFDVDVAYQAYMEVKSAALAELEKVFDGTHKIESRMIKEITSELGAANYEWQPSINALRYQPKSDDERMFIAFFVGGLIFGGYAQLMDGDHLIQPKRSRLLLALGLQSQSAGFKLEDSLFAQLKEKANTPCEELPWRPTFFPYLLAKGNTPHEMLTEVALLRKSSAVEDYRDWLKEVNEDWNQNGRISTEKAKDIQTIASSINQTLGVVPPLANVQVKVTMADVINPSAKIPGGVDITPILSKLWGWFLASLPGNRHRKLLTRAIVVDHEYVKIENRIKTVWDNAIR